MNILHRAAASATRAVDEETSAPTSGPMTEVEYVEDLKRRRPETSAAIRRHAHLLNVDDWETLCEDAPELADAIASEIFTTLRRERYGWSTNFPVDQVERAA